MVNKCVISEISITPSVVSNPDPNPPVPAVAAMQTIMIISNFKKIYSKDFKVLEQI